MINKNLNDNSSNRVEDETLAENGVQGYISKNEKNNIMFRVSEHLMQAGILMVQVSGEMASIYLQLGEAILKEIDLKDDKMTEDEVQNIMDDILNIKGTL